MSLFSITEIVSSLFMPKKHLVGLDTIHMFFSSHAHMHIFTRGSMVFKHIDGRKFLCVLFDHVTVLLSCMCSDYQKNKQTKKNIQPSIWHLVINENIYFGTRQAN